MLWSCEFEPPQFKQECESDSEDDCEDDTWGEYSDFYERRYERASERAATSERGGMYPHTVLGVVALIILLENLDRYLDPL